MYPANRKEALKSAENIRKVRSSASSPKRVQLRRGGTTKLAPKGEEEEEKCEESEDDANPRAKKKKRKTKAASVAKSKAKKLSKSTPSSQERVVVHSSTFPVAPRE